VNKLTPDGWHTVTPRIVTGDVAGLVGFLKTVFNADGEYRTRMPAEIKIGDSIVMISDGGGRREAKPVRDPWGNTWQIATRRQQV